MTQSPLMAHVLARRPWLADVDAISAFGFTQRPQNVSRPDEGIARRLIAAYKRAERECPVNFRPNDVWRQFVEAHYGDMLALVRADDCGGLIDYLLALPEQGAGHGYFQGKLACAALRSDVDKQRERARWLLDHLLGFAECRGLLRERCPEQGAWSEPAIKSAYELCAELEAVVGLPMTLPNLFSGMFVLEPERAPCHLRTLMPAYALDQLRAFFCNVLQRPMDSVRVTEIGAGIGHTAYLASKLGVARYTLIDLPEINLAQGFYLMSLVGAEHVRLYGENRGPALEVLPTWRFESTMSDGADAVLNIDSFPEIARDATRQYLQAMRSGTEYFFSINQEAPRRDPVDGQRESVRAMVEKYTDFAPLQRTRNWLRAGYVDEIFRINPD